MINNEPLVYVILVNYKGLQDTIECIESLKDITYKNYKIIVVDNASLDNSVEILKSTYSDEIILIDLKENLGFAGGNNEGIKLAVKENADYVLLLNNDTIVDKNFLQALVKRAEENEKTGIVGGKIYYFDDKNLIWYAGAKINSFTGSTRHIGVDQYDEGQFNKVIDVDYVTGCLMLLPVEVIKKVGMMNEEYFLYYEETDWSVRIKKAGYKLLYEPQSIIYHKVSSSTKKINYVMSYYYDRNSYYFIMKNYGFINRVFMYVYKRIFLLLKYIKGKFSRNEEKCIMIRKAYKSIKNEEMGKYNG